MKQDDVITEVRRIRDAHAAKFGYDLKAIVRDFRSREGKDGSPVVLAHAQPHSVSPVYDHSMVGQRIAASQDLTVAGAFLERVHRHEQDPMTNGAPIIKRTYPVRRPGHQRIVGVLSVETILL